MTSDTPAGSDEPVGGDEPYGSDEPHAGDTPNEADQPEGSDGPGSLQAQAVEVLGAHGTIATLGVLFVGLALVLTRVGGAAPTATAWLGLPPAWWLWGLAGLALVTFALSRHGVVDPHIGGGMAAILSLSVLVGDVLTVYGILAVWQLPLGFPLAWVPAVMASALGTAQAARIRPARTLEVTRYGLGALLIGALGFILGNVGALVFALVPLSLAPADNVSIRLVVFTVGFGLSLAAFAGVVLSVLDYDRSFVDLQWPSLRDLAVAGLGLFTLFVALAGIGALLQFAGLPTATSGIEEQAREFEDPVFILWLVPLSWLVIGPGEELVYRNLVQKYLREVLAPWPAIGVASAIFAGAHFSQYASPNPLATTVTLAMIFALAIILGYTYERTENLVVPILIHGTFNALQFTLLYVTITGGLPNPA
jgi:membrane protease YdiL (CAAX protease family)